MLIHELGHALGLKHTFEGGASLPSGEDGYHNSVMSYTAYPGYADSIGFILDGFPRTLSQAKVLDEMLEKIGNKLDVVFYFAVSKESIVLRLSGRRICNSCGANYHIKYVPSSEEGICDKCSGKLYQRADDKLETVLERIKVYHEQTEDLIDYYNKNGILKEIESESNIESIKKNILDAIRKASQKADLVNHGVV